jgi:hypothetical protein
MNEVIVTDPAKHLEEINQHVKFFETAIERLTVWSKLKYQCWHDLSIIPLLKEANQRALAVEKDYVMFLGLSALKERGEVSSTPLISEQLKESKFFEQHQRHPAMLAKVVKLNKTVQQLGIAIRTSGQFSPYCRFNSYAGIGSRYIRNIEEFDNLFSPHLKGIVKVQYHISYYLKGEHVSHCNNPNLSDKENVQHFLEVFKFLSTDILAKKNHGFTAWFCLSYDDPLYARAFDIKNAVVPDLADPSMRPKWRVEIRRGWGMARELWDACESAMIVTPARHNRKFQHILKAYLKAHLLLAKICRIDTSKSNVLKGYDVAMFLTQTLKPEPWKCRDVNWSDPFAVLMHIRSEYGTLVMGEDGNYEFIKEKE